MNTKACRNSDQSAMQHKHCYVALMLAQNAVTSHLDISSSENEHASQAQIVCNKTTAQLIAEMLAKIFLSFFHGHERDASSTKTSGEDKDTQNQSSQGFKYSLVLLNQINANN